MEMSPECKKDRSLISVSHDCFVRVKSFVKHGKDFGRCKADRDDVFSVYCMQKPSSDMGNKLRRVWIEDLI
jgi:hypothetical protein